MLPACQNTVSSPEILARPPSPLNNGWAAVGLACLYILTTLPPLVCTESEPACACVQIAFSHTSFYQVKVTVWEKVLRRRLPPRGWGAALRRLARGTPGGARRRWTNRGGARRRLSVLLSTGRLLKLPVILCIGYYVMASPEAASKLFFFFWFVPINGVVGEASDAPAVLNGVFWGGAKLWLSPCPNSMNTHRGVISTKGIVKGRKSCIMLNSDEFRYPIYCLRIGLYTIILERILLFFQNHWLSCEGVSGVCVRACVDVSVFCNAYLFCSHYYLHYNLYVPSVILLVLNLRI